MHPPPSSDEVACDRFVNTVRSKARDDYLHTGKTIFTAAMAAEPTAPLVFRSEAWEWPSIARSLHPFHLVPKSVDDTSPVLFSFLPSQLQMYNGKLRSGDIVPRWWMPKYSNSWDNVFRRSRSCPLLRSIRHWAVCHTRHHSAQPIAFNWCSTSATMRSNGWAIRRCQSGCGTSILQWRKRTTTAKASTRGGIGSSGKSLQVCMTLSDISTWHKVIRRTHSPKFPLVLRRLLECRSRWKGMSTSK